VETSSKIENTLSNRLQKDIIKIAGKVVFVNPFLYGRLVDKKTNKWLCDLGQIATSELQSNRYRFYPYLEWSLLSKEEKMIKDGSIEMFLKTLSLINTFYPKLTYEELTEIEKRMCLMKKDSFEGYAKKSIQEKAKFELRKNKKLKRDRFIRSWKDWLALEKTNQVLLPLIILISISAFIGWSVGISRNSCNPYFESNIGNKYEIL